MCIRDRNNCVNNYMEMLNTTYVLRMTGSPTFKLVSPSPKKKLTRLDYLKSAKVLYFAVVFLRNDFSTSKDSKILFISTSHALNLSTK